MSRVFINYRTEDEEASATLIERDLSRRFGSDEIFRASKSIKPGDDFARAILRAVRRADALLAVIGPRWLEARDRRGQRRIDDRSDWTRREITEAFTNGVLVIPVLVNDAPRLSAAVLPRALRQLVNCQYRRLSHRNADADLDQLAHAVSEAIPELTGSDVQVSNPGSGHVRNRIGDVHGTSIQTNDYKDRRRGMSGNVSGRTVGTVIGESHGPVNTGGGAQYNAPQFHGDGAAYVAGDNSGGIHTDSERRGRSGRHTESREDDV